MWKNKYVINALYNITGLFINWKYDLIRLKIYLNYLDSKLSNRLKLSHRNLNHSHRIRFDSVRIRTDSHISNSHKECIGVMAISGNNKSICEA